MLEALRAAKHENGMVLYIHHCNPGPVFFLVENHRKPLNFRDATGSLFQDDPVLSIQQTKMTATQKKILSDRQLLLQALDLESSDSSHKPCYRSCSDLSSRVAQISEVVGRI